MNYANILNAEVAALRAEIARQRSAKALEEVLANPPRPLPDLQTYGYDVADVVSAIRRRGIHPTEVAWLADFIEALGDYNARAGN